MPLTKATPEVIDVDKLTVNLKSNTLSDGIRDYVDDTIVSTVTALTELIDTEAEARSDADTAAYERGIANGIDAKLYETNSTTADLNTLGLTGKYWIGNTNTNRPEIESGVFLEHFVLEVVCLSASDTIQFAKNATHQAHRYGYGGTNYGTHQWYDWVFFETTDRLTTEIEYRNTRSTVNGIDACLAETNTTTADLNTLTSTGKHWIETTNWNRPEIESGVFLEHFVLEVVCLNSTDLIQFAKNATHQAHRYASGGTNYGSHSWSQWVFFENGERLTQEIYERKTRGVANGIDAKLAETNSTTANLNTLGLTGKYWVGISANGNRPEISPGVYLTHFVLEVVCLSDSDTIQFAKHTGHQAHRYGSNGTNNTNHTWSPWVFFETTDRLTAEIEYRNTRGIANGIDAKLAETNSTTVDLNALTLTGKHWIGATNGNRPEISPGVFLEYFLLEVVCLNSTDLIQFAKNTSYQAHRYASGGTNYNNHTSWSPWVIFSSLDAVNTLVGTATGSADAAATAASAATAAANDATAAIANIPDYHYTTEHIFSSGTGTLVIPANKGCRFFLLGAGGGGSTRGGGQSSDAYGGTGESSTIAIGANIMVSASGGTGAGNGYYEYVTGPAGVKGTVTIARDSARVLAILNENRAFSPSIMLDTLGIGSPLYDFSWANQGVGNKGGDGAYADGWFFNTSGADVTLSISIGVGGAHTHLAGNPGGDGYAVLYT